MFLDQVIDADGSFLLPWKDIRSSLQNKQGRTPKWYFYLQTHFTRFTQHNSSYHLTYEIKTPIIQNNMIPRHNTPAKSNKSYKHRNLWISFWDNDLKVIQYGKLQLLKHTIEIMRKLNHILFIIKSIKFQPT